MKKKPSLLKLLLISMISIFMIAAAGCSSSNSSSEPAKNDSGKEAKASTWPKQTINLVVFSAAGGGTDLGNRALAAAMEKELNAKINVVNMPGGSGGVAANYVSSKPHDGYTLLGMTEGLFPSAVLGVHPSTSKDWEYFLMGGTPAVISVRADSPYKTINDVIDAMKKDPGQVKLANSVVGCIWDIKAALIQQATGVDYKFMPYQGSNPSILATLSGEVDVVLTGIGEQSEYLAAKKLRPLAIVEEEAYEVPGYGKVASIVDSIPELKGKLSSNQIVGFAAPSDVPKDVVEKLDNAFKKAMESKEVTSYADTKYLNLKGLSGSEAKDYVKSMESLFSWILFDKGVAVRSPEEYQIPKPE